MLKIEDIHTYYGDSYVLQGVSLEVKKGMVLAMLGRNGVGKDDPDSLHRRVYAGEDREGFSSTARRSPTWTPTTSSEWGWAWCLRDGAFSPP